MPGRGGPLAYRYHHHTHFNTKLHLIINIPRDSAEEGCLGVV